MLRRLDCLLEATKTAVLTEKATREAAGLNPEPFLLRKFDPCITQNHAFAVRPRTASSAWLNAITRSDFTQFYFMTRSKQSTNLASISSTNLMELPVILPPEPEQQSILTFIADQTARFDTLTTEAQRAIDLLQERRTALISADVTGQIDVRGAV
ncbi:MAG: hypothetical protein RIS90_2246 [Pseudomonadota bacterium]